ncbi:restriction endonuclease subunit S [Lactobacillus panisapium]|uniref:restriction endonuclease subunit S n=1 Tax=Lactobacillus panisapium TaxID=2012495 RepID=UPI0022DED7B1|nr:restriction endonuclease subunit S [Lactobacillus panisapium]
MNEKKLIPNIRFKGFQEEWKKTRIKNIVQYSSSSFSISELKENNEGNTYPVYDATGTKYYSKKFDMHDDYIAIIKDGSNVGKTRLLPAKTSVLSTMGYLKALNSDILFDFYSITNTNFDKYKVGSGIPHIYFSDYKKECKLIPKISEQQKIGTFFAKLDRLLDLQQQKLDQLELLKKALLQKLFPKQDAKIPELRFKGFAEEWKKEELGSLSDIVRGASPRPIQDKKWFSKDSNIGWLRISDVTEQNGKIYHLEQKLSPLGQEKTRVVKNKHLLLSIAATVGSPVINYIPTGVHDGFLIFLNPQFNIDFMFQWLTYYKNNWAKYGQPGSQVNLNSKIVKNQRIYIPGLNEQQKIGNLFAKIDRLIELQNKKFDNLKQVKKSLLQNMFVE